MNDLLRRAWDALDAFKQAYPENWHDDDERVLKDLMRADLKLSGVELNGRSTMDKETVIALANKTGLFDYFDLEGDSVGQLILHNFAALVAAHEREACAQLFESPWSSGADRMYMKECAAAIRSRT